jgi:glycerol-3-phosphate acyltransferase PlsY|tara:strand:+ start:5259 stop:5885 length:627 start_codon:yes stop_codon:yes gene_type:complete
MGALFAALGSLLVGYLIGSIPFAVLIARGHGVDIFTLGSGNPGATNVMRNLGKKAGYTCFLLDAGKGISAAALGFFFANLSTTQANPELVAILGLIGAILGHSFSLFLKFRGGKGVATTVGGLFVILPVVMLIGIGLWVLLFYSTRYVSLASIALGLSLPFSAFFLGSDLALGLCLALCVLIVVRHRANIQRLLAGTENRAGSKSKSS